MSRDNLSSLLDSMLDDSVNAMREAEQAEAQERLRKEQERQASTLRSKQEKEPDAPLFDDVEAFTGLTDQDMRAILAKAKPDDVLIMLATSSDVLQRRVLRNMDPESVKWVRTNLAMIEDVTGAERRAAHGGVLKVANKLHAAGTVGVPEASAIGSDEAPDADEKALRDMLCDLARIAGKSGAIAVTEVVANSREPMLVGGLTCIVAGEKDAELRASLAPLRDQLLAVYSKRLAWMEEALVAIAAGEDEAALREKLK